MGGAPCVCVGGVTWSARDTSPMMCRDRDRCFYRGEVVHRLHSFGHGRLPLQVHTSLLSHHHRSAALTTAGWKCASRKERSGTAWEQKCGTWHTCLLGECEGLHLSGSAVGELDRAEVGVKLQMVHAVPLVGPFPPQKSTQYACAQGDCGAPPAGARQARARDWRRLRPKRHRGRQSGGIRGAVRALRFGQSTCGGEGRG